MINPGKKMVSEGYSISVWPPTFALSKLPTTEDPHLDEEEI